MPNIETKADQLADTLGSMEEMNKISNVKIKFSVPKTQNQARNS